jgi:hypothetical protein
MKRSFSEYHVQKELPGAKKIVKEVCLGAQRCASLAIDVFFVQPGCLGRAWNRLGLISSPHDASALMQRCSLRRVLTSLSPWTAYTAATYPATCRRRRS